MGAERDEEAMRVCTKEDHGLYEEKEDEITRACGQRGWQERG